MATNDLFTKRGALGTLGVLGVMLLACPASLDDRCAEGACVPGGSLDGSLPNGDGGADAPPPDPCVDTPNDPKCLDDATALFVSAAGSDAGAGTRSAPFKTIGAALAKVTPEKKRVYVCTGDYPENVTITTTVSVIGGLACSWTEAGPKPKIAPPKGVAVTIKNAQTVALVSLDIEGSADGQVKGDSAIGVFVSTSTGVVLKNASVRSGPGVQGIDGTPGENGPNYTAAIAVSGPGNMGASGGGLATCEVCKDGSHSIGGKGADSGGVPTKGAASPDVGTSNAGSSAQDACNDGRSGANGAAGEAQPGSTSPGKLTAAGWESSTDAKAGVNGNPGQGGGGGGSKVTPALGGGSGGCGGCGGSGGTAGGNGGSSFGVVAFNSVVTLRDTAVSSSPAGKGGSGGTGEAGQERAGGGSGVCIGGAGGYGAGGGGGGGGAGGSSIAIAYVGSPPDTDGTVTLQHGAAGGHGDGGLGGPSSGIKGNDGKPGADGKSGDVLAL